MTNLNQHTENDPNSAEIKSEFENPPNATKLIAKIFEPHPLAEIFPMIKEDDFRKLVEDIRDNGLREPITLFEGKILDGRNRYRACLEAQIEPRFDCAAPVLSDDAGCGSWTCPVCSSEVDGRQDTCGECCRASRVAHIPDPLRHVLSLNLRRRHLSTSERAMIAAKLAKLHPGSNQHVENSTPSQAEAADYMCVSRESVIHGRAVLDKGILELVNAASDGKIAVSAARKLAQLAPERQRTVLQGGPAAVRKAVSELRKGRPAQPVLDDVSYEVLPSVPASPEPPEDVEEVGSVCGPLRTLAEAYLSFARAHLHSKKERCIASLNNNSRPKDENWREPSCSDAVDELLAELDGSRPPNKGDLLQIIKRAAIADIDLRYNAVADRRTKEAQSRPQISKSEVEALKYSCGESENVDEQVAELSKDEPAFAG